MRFEIKLGNEIIGFSELPYCIEHRDSWITIPELTVSVAGGAPIECSGGVQINDFSPELGVEGLEIYINGIPYPYYAELFPHHVEAYKKQFKRKS